MSIPVSKRAISILIVALCGILIPNASFADTKTRVKLNGKFYPVFFNDGDSFRVLRGDLKDSKARLAGFNTLESYGPVHSWGDWTTKELYVVAKLGTKNAQKGIWECTSDLSKDTYGRYLWKCPDLSEDQIRKGLAHALNITSNSSPKRYVDAQRDAVKARRGIWAHGVPEYVLTSLHSVAERSGDRPAYNRLVSVVDGHSLKWKHRDVYEECQDVCWEPKRSEQVERFIVRFTRLLKKELDSSTQTALDEVIQNDTTFTQKMDESLTQNTLLTFSNTPFKAQADSVFKSMATAGWVEAANSQIKTCMIYVDFRRRFGADRAVCLK
jgi:endonuclease YncB( thermonuclease family)